MNTFNASLRNTAACMGPLPASLSILYQCRECWECRVLKKVFILQRIAQGKRPKARLLLIKPSVSRILKKHYYEERIGRSEEGKVRIPDFGFLG